MNSSLMNLNLVKRQVSLGVFAASMTGLVTAVMVPQSGTVLPKATPDQRTFFETKVRPVLAANCFPCHGGASHSSGLKLDNLMSVEKGGESGPVLVPGMPEKSLLLHVIQQTGNLKMPPGGKKLAANEIADIEAWIKMGAPWPDLPDASATPDKAVAWWSLEPVKKPLIPSVKNVGWVRNPIDALVLSKLEAKHLTPNGQADKRTLIRRLTFDLTGLAPTISEVENFLADKSVDAYEKLVDRILASPHYGERWARHWMDVARYADTKGYVFNEDRGYPNAYTYRNWLIDAFNKDLPYDQFIIQQLAADRLPAVQASDGKKILAALGYLTLGRRFINSVPDIIDDRIDVTMRGFQGLTVGCARGHDHKFDPIPTQDYYSLYAVFNSSEEVTKPISESAVNDPWEAYTKQVSGIEADLRDRVLKQTQRLRTIWKTPGDTSLSAPVKQILQSLGEGASPDASQLKTLLPNYEMAEREKIQQSEKMLEDLKQHAPKVPELAMAMQDRSNCSDGVVFKRGNPGNPGDPAPRRFLLALSKHGTERPHWTSGSGRLELAESIASKENPLTARVFVNRVWQDHFGAGIVRTPSDYGHQGEKPTDPNLLDFLASWFMEHGWSIKKLHRLIVTSATYRQSSSVSPQMANADPDNRLWGRMNRRRLDFEQTRDALVQASGQLALNEVGGKSIDLWAKPFTTRRAVYGFIERQNLPGIFRTFDFASPDSHSARRFQTTVPQQALFFMNSAFSIDQAKSLCGRTEIKASAGNAQCVRRLYLLLFQRMPDAEELKAGISFLGADRNELVEAPVSEWHYGYGGFDAAKQRTTLFTPLDYFGENSYRVGKEFPDRILGYITVNPNGGHPGHDGSHAVIRRWVAPDTMTVSISGLLSHRQKEGDGVRARIVSSRYGLVDEWSVHNSEARTDVASVSVQKGDTLDFAVDPIASDGYDGFGWAPVIQVKGGHKSWDSTANFGPPSERPLTRLELYAQALTMTNEFDFID